MYEEVINDIIKNLNERERLILLHLLIQEKIRLVGLNNFYVYLNLIFNNHNSEIENESK